MWLPLSTLAALCVLVHISETALQSDLEDLDLVFRERTHSDWKDAWHKERFSRCRETLVKHLFWACEKDIYRLTRRSQPRDTDIDVRFPWQSPQKAHSFLRLRRTLTRRSSSITNECCKSTGCTWEEYAEYCPTNKRYTTFV
nr:unnamed protein product [Callosobruchus chinensis]